jgi:hypothetical protein
MDRPRPGGWNALARLRVYETPRVRNEFTAILCSGPAAGNDQVLAEP